MSTHFPRWELDATALAGVVTSATRVVTYTISGGV